MKKIAKLKERNRSRFRNIWPRLGEEDRQELCREAGVDLKIANIEYGDLPSQYRDPVREKLAAAVVKDRQKWVKKVGGNV